MPDRRVRSVVLAMRDRVHARQKSQKCCFSHEGSCARQTEEPEMFLAMRDCVDARQKSQKCCFNNEGLCACQTEESEVLF